jgi:hypothetical protein
VLDREHGRLSILYRHGILPKNKISPPSARASSSTRCSGLSVLERRETSAPRRGHRAIGTILDGTLVTTTRRGAACRRLFEVGLRVWSKAWVETRNISTGIGYLNCDRFDRLARI